jgi:hypothetical protein
MKKLKRTLAGLCLGLLFLPLAGYAQQSEEERARNYFTDTEVIDQNGKKLRFYSDVLRERVVLISFIFTNCEYACPMLAQKLKQARGLMVPAINSPRNRAWMKAAGFSSPARNRTWNCWLKNWASTRRMSRRIPP